MATVADPAGDASALAAPALLSDQARAQLGGDAGAAASPAVAIAPERIGLDEQPGAFLVIDLVTCVPVRHHQVKFVVGGLGQSLVGALERLREAVHFHVIRIALVVLKVRSIKEGVDRHILAVDGRYIVRDVVTVEEGPHNVLFRVVARGRVIVTPEHIRELKVGRRVAIELNAKRASVFGVPFLGLQEFVEQGRPRSTQRIAGRVVVVVGTYGFDRVRTGNDCPFVHVNVEFAVREASDLDVVAIHQRRASDGDARAGNQFSQVEGVVRLDAEVGAGSDRQGSGQKGGEGTGRLKFHVRNENCGVKREKGAGEMCERMRFTSSLAHLEPRPGSCLMHSKAKLRVFHHRLTFGSSL